MISVGNFARHSSVWSAVTPTLDEVVRLANSDKSSLGRAVPSLSQPARHSLIAETAFLLAKEKTSVTERGNLEVEESARKFLVQLPRSEKLGDPLDDSEWWEVNEICDKIMSYTHWMSDVEFSPMVPGCGVVDQAVADVATQFQLIEIKAVNRPFKALDLRQLLTYLAMFYAKGRNFENATVLNPRLGDYFSISLDSLCAGASGKAAVEVLQDLIEWMTGLQVSA